jgi:hypothetical protein
MKKMMLLTAVAFVATLALGTTAEAQTLTLKPMFATVACKGNTAACVKLDLYQKMADTGPSAGSAAAATPSGGASSHNNPVAARQGRSTAGGVENNPAEGGGGSVMATLHKNAVRQAQRSASRARVSERSHAGAVRPVRNALERRGGNPTGNNPTVERASAQSRSQAAARPVYLMRPSASERRHYDAVHQRMVTRHRPTDF